MLTTRVLALSLLVTHIFATQLFLNKDYFRDGLEREKEGLMKLLNEDARE